eukprot:14267491-Alexandrium_andersonii.AAC.1
MTMGCSVSRSSMTIGGANPGADEGTAVDPNPAPMKALAGRALGHDACDADGRPPRGDPPP